MKFNSIEFVKGAVSPGQCPETTYSEIAFAGRSNVGKSSLINSLTNKKKIARTSNTPGKTRQMNYYLVDNKIYFVDLPGYGYAKVPESERKKWGEYIRQYLLQRENLIFTIHLVDIRHKPTKLDEEFIYWMASNQRPFVIVLNKADKISRNKREQSYNRIRMLLGEMNIDIPVITCSSSTKTGITTLKQTIVDFLEGAYLIE